MIDQKVIDQRTDKGGASERRWKRYRVEIRIKVTTAIGALKFAYGQGSDISEGGMAAYIPAELDPGNTTEIEMMFPYCKERVEVMAMVRNRNGFRYGLEFTGLEPSEREILLRSLKALSLVQ